MDEALQGALEVPGQPDIASWWVSLFETILPELAKLLLQHRKSIAEPIGFRNRNQPRSEFAEGNQRLQMTTTHFPEVESSAG